MDSLKSKIFPVQIYFIHKIQLFTNFTIQLLYTKKKEKKNNEKEE